MKTLITTIAIMVISLSCYAGDYDFKCTEHKGDKVKNPIRCENKEVVCYFIGCFIAECFKK